MAAAESSKQPEKGEGYEMVVSSGEESSEDEDEVKGADMLATKKVVKGTDELEREKSRKEIAQRSKMWTTVGSSDEEEEPGEEEAGGGGGETKKRQADDDASGSDSESESDGDRKESSSAKKAKKKDDKKKKKEKKKKEKSSKKHKKEKKHKKDKKYKKKKKGKRSDSSSDSGSDEDDEDGESGGEGNAYDLQGRKKLGAVNQDEYGKYGIISTSDRYKKQREFEAWCAEVKKCPGVINGAQWEVLEYFRDFMEDYNTATLPHMKFYDYETWESMDYARKQQVEAKKSKRTRTQFDDDEALRSERKQTREEKQAARLAETIQLMDGEKVSDMKHQKLLQHEMQHAYKTGDVEKQKRLEMRLNPEIEDAKWGKYTAPDHNLREGV